MKRRWFQIHLSTAIVMMFVAGGMLCLNVCPSIHKRQMGGDSLIYTNHGWPWVCCFESEHIEYSGASHNQGRTWKLWPTVWNAAAFFGTLGVVGLFMEWRFLRLPAFTWVMLGLTLGILAGLNLRSHQVAVVLAVSNLGGHIESIQPAKTNSDSNLLASGWPWLCRVEGIESFQNDALIRNVLTALAILILIGICTEFFLRHRERCRLPRR